MQQHPSLPAKQLYSKLFQPLQLNKNKNVTLKNRLIMGSMHTGLEGHSFPSVMEQILRHTSSRWQNKFDRLANFYAARAKGGVGMIITGGFSPNMVGALYPFGSKLDCQVEAEFHKVVTSAVKEQSISNYEFPKDSIYAHLNIPSASNAVEDYETKICLQILHAGRYAAHPFAVSSTNKKSPISAFSPRKMTHKDSQSTIDDFIRSAMFAKEAGYHGVEVMGSEGYLINQFLSPCTAAAQTLEDRVSFPMKIIRGIRNACGDSFIIVYRISLIDLVSNGMPWEEVVALAKCIDEDGSVSILNAGIGWHESRIPTIATVVPRGAWSWAVEKLKQSLPDLSTPVSVVNRINAPHVAERLLQGPNSADLVTLARPFLADEMFPLKAFNGVPDFINTCIGCNQACLDHAFQGKTASCLVNPTACHETFFDFSTPRPKQRIAVIGAGPAGLSFAVTAKKLGHEVTLYDQSKYIGGQFNIAKLIPGKQEFFETLRYFEKHLKFLDVKMNLGVYLDQKNILDLLGKNKFDKVVLAAGVTPRIPSIIGIDHEKVITYYDLLTGRTSKRVGNKVAILGAGGIGFDVADYLLHRADQYPRNDGFDNCPADHMDSEHFFKQWGLNKDNNSIGLPQPFESDNERRKIYLLQRKSGKLGASLGKTTGWIHRSNLKHNRVHMINSVTYERITDEGLLISRQNEKGQKEEITLDVDNIILCTGQESNKTLLKSLMNLFSNEESDTKRVYVIGGAYQAGELDAKRAIDMGMRLAFRIHEKEVDENDLKERMSGEEKLIKMIKA